VTGTIRAIEPLPTGASGTIGAIRTMGAVETIRGICVIESIKSMGALGGGKHQIVEASHLNKGYASLTCMTLNVNHVKR
jgi:hypothetical protein